MADEHGYPNEKQIEYLVSELTDARDKINVLINGLKDKSCTMGRLIESLPFPVRYLGRAINFAKDAMETKK